MCVPKDLNGILLLRPFINIFKHNRICYGSAVDKTHEVIWYGQEKYKPIPDSSHQCEFYLAAID